MIVIQFRQYLLHDRFTEERSLSADTELVTILSDGSHLAVIQVYDLPVSSHKRFLLFLKILRIDAGRIVLTFFGHFCLEIKFRQS